MGVLSEITFEQKIKAFEKARENFNDQEGKLVLITEEYYDGALQLFKTFVRTEPACSSIALEPCDEYKAIWRAYIEQHFSLMVVHKDTGEPMALRTTGISKATEKLDPSLIQDDGFKKVVDFLNVVDDEVNFFERYKCDEALHFFGLCVAEKYRKRGLATKIFRAAMDMIRHLELGSVVVKGEGSSNFSKRIYEQQGFETLHEIQYSEYLVNGEQVFCKVSDHKSMKTYGIKIQ